MRKNEKIKEIENLFEGGPVDIFKILHFLIEYGELYRKLEFRANSNETLRFYKKNKENEEMIFLDLTDNSGNKLISGYQVEVYKKILEIPQVKQMDLISKKFSINHIVE